MEVASLPKKRSRTEGHTTLSKIITRGARQSSDGGRLEKRSEIRAVEGTEKADVIK